LQRTRRGTTNLVDPRPHAVGSIAAMFERYPIGTVLPAMGYGDAQLAELEQTINATPCDAVVTGTPMDLARLIDIRHPVRMRLTASPTTTGRRSQTFCARSSRSTGRSSWAPEP
jgi:predicted GTPase